ncbi:MAG: 23S rRNA (adenine(2030)-N(6))-methyltransferase RlmJ [Gammaproteobacteria bacterium]|nr:23S rRNA (adenine(2030)-N(6))-methyltransferase RlmJ [Gammaproteobacteria bacterium]
MLSYRHLYHAGNFADVVKHVVLVALLEAITRKPTPCYVQDTHAGCGAYALDSHEAQQGKEHQDGIGRIWQIQEAPQVIHRYLEIVREWNAGLPEPRYYPGSPAIAQSLLRKSDRLVLTELHPQDHDALVNQFQDDKRIRIHKQDAYQGLKAFLPPPEKRGLVLIDPPFERKDEYDRVVAGLQTGYSRWSHGIYAIWYPIMSRGLQTRFLEACVATGIRKILHCEFLIAPFSSDKRFVGCGMLIVNPPWQIDTTLEICLQWLQVPLRQANDVQVRVDWLVPE